MMTITTRMVESADEVNAVYRLRYEYYVGWCEIDVAIADHARLQLHDERDAAALAFATFAGPDPVGTFRIEVSAPQALSFGADWRFADFLADVPERLGLVSWFVTDPHLRDTSVVAHMVERSVAIARGLDVDHVFFECCPAHWPLFHRAGLKRRGGAIPHRLTGLQSAVFHLDRSDRHAAALVARDFGAPVLVRHERAPEEANEAVPQRATRARPLALVSGGN